MTKNSVLGAVLLSFFTLSAYAQKPQIQWNSDYDFEAIETFQWQLTPDTDLEKANPFLHTRIKTAIEYQLAKSGLTEVQSNPDIYVNYHASSEKQVRLESETYGYGFGGYGRGRWGFYGYGSIGPTRTTTRVIEYARGTLVVDLWDAKSNELIWRGTVSDTVPNDVRRAEKLIDKAVTKLADQGRKLWSKEQARRAR